MTPQIDSLLTAHAALSVRIAKLEAENRMQTYKAHNLLNANEQLIDERNEQANKIAELEAKNARLQSELTSDDCELAKRAMGLAQKNLNLEGEVSRLAALLVEQGHTDKCKSRFCVSCHCRACRMFEPGPCNCHLSTLPTFPEQA
jgi:hypothetical protein